MCCNNGNVDYNGNFTYVGYATDVNGSNFNLIRNTSGVTRNFMSIYVSKTALDENSPSFPNFFLGRYYFIGDLNVDSFISVLNIKKESFTLAPPNINGNRILLTPSMPIDVRYIPDVYLNGVYIDINLITYTPTSIIVNLTNLSVEPKVSDNVNIKYLKQ